MAAMTLPNLLALTFATASLANGVDECIQLYIFLSSSKNRNHQAKATAQTPITTFQQYLPRFVEVGSRYHFTTHAALWLSCVWSLSVSNTTRSAIGAVLAFEFGAMATAAYVMPAVNRIHAAKTTDEVEIGIRRVLGRQLIRLATTHAPSVLVCLYAFASS